MLGEGRATAAELQVEHYNPIHLGRVLSAWLGVEVTGKALHKVPDGTRQRYYVVPYERATLAAWAKEHHVPIADARKWARDGLLQGEQGGWLSRYAPVPHVVAPMPRKRSERLDHYSYEGKGMIPVRMWARRHKVRPETAHAWRRQGLLGYSRRLTREMFIFECTPKPDVRRGRPKK
jgi:hypothetical protein